MDCGGGDDDDLFFFVFFASANKIEQQDYSNEKVVQNDQMVFFSFEIFLHQEDLKSPLLLYRQLYLSPILNFSVLNDKAR